MSMNVNVDEAWAPEPELLETAPRRIVPFEDVPDRNRPNVLVMGGVSGLLLVVGFALFGLGITKRGGSIPLGIPLMLAGIAGLVYFPWRLRQHLQRVEHLLTNGVPVMARILSADNLNGDTYARNVKYQVAVPGGDLSHREVNVDDRVLPKRIPSNVTALMDLSTADVELYIALPYRAVAKPAPVIVQTQLPQSASQRTPQAMGTIAVSDAPEIKRDKPKDETPAPKRETFE
jgi:hypothetical protein